LPTSEAKHGLEEGLIATEPNEVPGLLRARNQGEGMLQWGRIQERFWH
jgi:hypothetical protein